MKCYRFKSKSALSDIAVRLACEIERVLSIKSMNAADARAASCAIELAKTAVIAALEIIYIGVADGSALAFPRLEKALAAYAAATDAQPAEK